MTFAASEPTLSLTVDNPDVLQQGSSPTHVFDRKGGTIGSSGDSWILFDRQRRVQAHHCEILYQDGGFLLLDRSGKTTVNDQTQPLGPGIYARLSNHDTLHIGPYRISVRLGAAMAIALEDDPVQRLAEHLDSLPVAAAEEGDADARPSPGWSEFHALGTSPSVHGLLDPLQALDASLEGATTLGHDLRPTSSLAAQADVATQFEAIYGAPQHAPGEPAMSEQDIPPAASQEWLQRQLSSQADPASLIEPVVDGIGAPIGAVDGQATYALLNEAGRTLGAMIRGLSALNVAEPGEQQRISLAGRTLQPIEDNPLRLGLDYPDTVRALFSTERSVVHLSPAAAVEESLEQIRRQQVAVHKAINAGLAALLQAFAPEQLEQRFQRYRQARGSQAQAGDWAWSMYGHYYEELTSGRQQGFDKLFWEVFEQAFDQAVRAEA